MYHVKLDALHFLFYVNLYVSQMQIYTKNLRSGFVSNKIILLKFTYKRRYFVEILFKSLQNCLYVLRFQSKMLIFILILKSFFSIPNSNVHILYSKTTTTKRKKKLKVYEKNYHNLFRFFVSAYIKHFEKGC